MSDAARADEWLGSKISPSISADGMQVSAQMCSRRWLAAMTRVVLSCAS